LQSVHDTAKLVKKIAEVNYKANKWQWKVEVMELKYNEIKELGEWYRDTINTQNE